MRGPWNFAWRKCRTRAARLRCFRDRLYAGLTAALGAFRSTVRPCLPPEWRLAGNLNFSFGCLDGETLLLNMKSLAASTGSACTSAHPEPSHVLRALGIPDEVARASLRFGLGRFNTAEEVEFVIGLVVETVNRLRAMSSLRILKP